MKFLKIVGLLIMLSCCLVGCYRWAPDEDELETVPTTNNPYLLPKPQEDVLNPTNF